MVATWITADDLSSPGDPMAPEAAKAASWALYMLSGQRYAGIRTAVEWYGYDVASCWCAPFLENGIWLSADSHVHNRVLSSMFYRQPTNRLRLRSNPVQSVSGVRISSETLPASGYALANDAILLRTGGQSWDFSRGVEVTYRYGTLPPTMGKNAAIRLGNEFLLAYCGSDKCSLPERVTNITRQGVSFTVLDPQDFLKQGRTGLYEVDLFLSIANPMNARKRARVYNPDWPRGERRR